MLSPVSSKAESTVIGPINVDTYEPPIVWGYSFQGVQEVVTPLRLEALDNAAPKPHRTTPDGLVLPTPVVDYLYQGLAKVSNYGRPIMVWDVLNHQYLYGGVFVLPNKVQVDLPAFSLPGTSLSLDLPSMPLEFAGGVVAPVETQAGTVIGSGSVNLTPPLKATLLAGLNKLPASTRNQLDFLARMLEGGDSDGRVTLGFAGGRDFREGKWRAGVSTMLTVKFGKVLTPGAN